MLMARIAANVGERQNDHREARGAGFFRRWGWRGLRLCWLADFKRIDADRFGDVLELGRSEITDREVKPPLYLTIGVLGEADRAWLGYAFQPRGDIDAVPHEIAILLFDDVTEMNADAELDAPIGLHASIAVDEASLHFDGAAHGIDYAAELDDAAVARALDDAAVMGGDGGVDEVATEAPQARKGAVLVRPGEPAVADDIGHQDCCEFPGLGHSSGNPALRRPSNTAGIPGPCSISHLTVSLGLRRRACAKASCASSNLPACA